MIAPVAKSHKRRDVVLRWLAVLRLAAAVVLAAAAIAGVAASAMAATLPDGRGYELASPIDKNGGDVIADPTRTRAAIDGNAVAFVSLTGFGDAIGTGITSEYVSRRDGTPGTSGWSTHAILPKLDPSSPDTVTSGLDSFYGWEFSSDLSQAVLRTYTNLSGDPNVVNVGNLYLRDDLLSPGNGSYTLLTACPACSVSGPLENDEPPSFADATPDFGHVIFEARSNLVPEATGGAFKLYEWDHGTLRLAGVLPDGSLPDRSMAGGGAFRGKYTQHTISADGSKIFFTVAPDGSTTSGDLYMRVDHTSTVKLNDSERTDCAGDPTCGGDGIPDLVPDPSPQPAQFQAATADGSKVFFTTSDALTDDASGTDLYMYDTTKPASDPHNLTMISPDNEPADGLDPAVDGVVGTSADGSYVYFVAQGQLVLNAPAIVPGGDGIYVWHAGAVHYIGTLADRGDDALGVDVAANTTYGLGQLAARVTPDGTHLAFTSHSGIGLTGYDQNTPACDASERGPCTEVYLYNATTDALSCVSCNPSGAPATSSANFTQSGVLGPTAQLSHLGHPLSDDGRYLFFTTGERLLPDDRNGKKRDAYEYDSVTGQLHLISSGRSLDDSFFLDATPDGRNVFFATREQLVGWDTDNAYDIYDARVSGGFSEPVRPPQECVGDACRGPLGSTPPAALPLSSVFFTGNDNVKSVPKPKPKPKKCRKGTVRKRVHGKVKCVKKKKPKAHRSARRAR
jgi:hypothetical protein